MEFPNEKRRVRAGGNFTARAAAYSKKMGALIKKWGGSRKKGVASEEKSPRSG